MHHHIMWDLETFGIKRNAIIWSIGAVKFTSLGVVDRFQVGVDPKDFERYGGKIDAATFEYWMQPKMDAARAIYQTLNKVDLHSALSGLADWIVLPADADYDLIEDYEVGSGFGKGATFDNVLLKDAYELAGLPYPLHYRQDECYRTIANRFPDIPYEQFGTAHDSLDDAMSQTDHLLRIVRSNPGMVL